MKRRRDKLRHLALQLVRLTTRDDLRWAAARPGRWLVLSSTPNFQQLPKQATDPAIRLILDMLRESSDNVAVFNQQLERARINEDYLRGHHDEYTYHLPKDPT